MKDKIESRGKWDIVASVLGDLDGWQRVAAIAVIVAGAVGALAITQGTLPV